MSGFSKYRITDLNGTPSELVFEVAMEYAQIVEGWYDGRPLGEEGLKYAVNMIGEKKVLRDARISSVDDCRLAKGHRELKKERA